MTRFNIIASSIFVTVWAVYVLQHEMLLTSSFHTENNNVGNAMRGNATRNRTVPAMPPLDSLRFHVRSTRKGVGDCGGCDVLDVLVATIKDLGYHTTDHGCPTFATNSNGSLVAGDRLVIIYNEFDVRCAIEGDNVVHVHWLLAPVGAHTGARQALRHFHPDDLVFNYGPWVSDLTISVPVTNILFMMNTPAKGDDTDPDVMAALAPVNRSGVIYSMRKGVKFHGPALRSADNKLPHELMNISAVEAPVNRDTIRQAEYFLTYDPYTFWTYKAAMWGTVSVVHPYKGMSKEEWVGSVCLGAYLRAYNLSLSFPGVAYGWDPSELDSARKTLNETRPFMNAANRWGKEETLTMMIRDSYRHLNGSRDNLEGALLAKTFFKDSSMLGH